MNQRTKKLNPKQRAEELISRFTQHGVEYNIAIYCALELILEIYYQLQVGYDNTYRGYYWQKVEDILKDKLR